MKNQDVRSGFLNYFVRNGHELVGSSSLIPEGDPTLLFTNAGMNQFKNLFIGAEKRNYTRAASSQKCVRAGGKHNDLDNVGFTARHHTFFEMLGNFSFGDYFKKDAIHFAWELLTREFGIPKEKLYVTVFQTDDEAADIWHKQEGVPRDRIFRFGEKDNFWRMGEVGPCGPCSEIFYDHGEHAGFEKDPFKGISAGEDRYVEIWNLVFMQYEEVSPGKLIPLPAPSVDTGSGLERVCAALQGKLNNYDTDLFWPLIEKAAKISGQEKLLDVIGAWGKKGIHGIPDPNTKELIAALRVVADHTRSTSFLIADGALPSNEGRGYVLRRILRRAARYSQKLTGEGAFLPEMAELFIQQMSSVYPELQQRKNLILETITNEQNRFLETLDTGLEILGKELKNAGTNRVLSGAVAFRLYDTSGFPLDLTQLIAAEKGFEVDVAGFEKALEQTRTRSQASWKGKGNLNQVQTQLVSWAQSISGETVFEGYRSTECSARISGLAAVHEVEAESAQLQVGPKLQAGSRGFLIADHTPFYAESGGQVADFGEVRTASGRARVFDVQKVQKHFVHSLEVVDGFLKIDENITMQVDAHRRQQIMNNHSATHLLHAALRTVLGNGITQAGSLVDDAKLRFDFTFGGSISSAQLLRIEELVNAQISIGVEVKTMISTPAEAIAQGALALFGEKYGEKVRVLKMGDFSTELCGGTHVANTANIRLFKIVSESGVSAGVRRIEALTGANAVRWFEKNALQNKESREALSLQENWETFLESENKPSLLIQKLKSENAELQKEIKKLKLNSLLGNNSANSGSADQGARTQIKVNGQACTLIVTSLPTDDRELLAKTADQIRDQNQPALVVLVGEGQGKGRVALVTVTKELSAVLAAGDVFKALSQIAGGKGGGRPQFAQGTVDNWPGEQAVLEQLVRMLAK